MASLSSCNIKIHEQCKVAPPSSATQLSLPLTFFDLIWLKFHPVERIFFYSLPLPHSDPSFFFDKVAPKLKTSLSLTLQHFHPLAGNIVWPSDSPKPFINFNPHDDDGVSLVLAQCDHDHDHAHHFNKILEHNSPREALESRSLVPHLESSDSHASVISLQITLFPNSGFCIGISTHHAVLDGKSSTMFLKAWASICKSCENSPPPPPHLLEPFLDREVIKDPNGIESLFINTWKRISSHFDNSNGRTRSLKILNSLQPMVKDSVRATFELTRGDLEKIEKRVLSKWDMVEGEAQAQAQQQPPTTDYSKPTTLSTFVLACAYVSVCIAKAIQEAEKDNNKQKQKFSIGFPVDCRARLEPPIPENYFGNCISNHIVDTEPEDFTKEDGVVIVAKNIYGKIKMLGKKGVLDGIETLVFRLMAMKGEGVKAMGVAGSTRFGFYETDFGWGRPAKVEIVSLDRGLTIGLTDTKDGRGGVEVGLVLNNHVMGLFQTSFHAGLCFD